jgi:hypothetical protein
MSSHDAVMMIIERSRAGELRVATHVAAKQSFAERTMKTSGKTSGIILLAAMLVAGVNQPAAAADDAKKATALPEDASAKKACANSTGQTKVECEKVAAKIDANTVAPRSATDRPELDSDDVRHSSTVVAKPDTKPTPKSADKDTSSNSQDKAAPKAPR